MMVIKHEEQARGSEGGKCSDNINLPLCFIIFLKEKEECRWSKDQNVTKTSNLALCYEVTNRDG